MNRVARRDVIERAREARIRLNPDQVHKLAAGGRVGTRLPRIGSCQLAMAGEWLVALRNEQGQEKCLPLAYPQ